MLPVILMKNLKSKLLCNKTFCLQLLLLIFAFCLLPSIATAQNKNVITVTPQLIQIDLSLEAPEAIYTYTNSTDQTIELALSMQDVKELEDRGLPGFLNSNQSQNYQYGLSSWASFSNKNLVIAPGESKSVTVYIDKTRLTLGGHYASVLAEVRQTDTTKSVKLRAILSSLLFVRSGSEYEQEDAIINEFKPIQEFFQLPTQFSFRLQNTGNVDITPYGILKVYDPFGKEVASGIVNENSLITLPDSNRKYSLPVRVQKSILLPGIYKAHIKIQFGKRKAVKEQETHFVSLGSIDIKWIGATLLLIVCAMSLMRLRKRQTK